MKVTWIVDNYKLYIESVNHEIVKELTYNIEEDAINALYVFLNAGFICKLSKTMHAE